MRCDGGRSGEALVEALRALDGAGPGLEAEVYDFLAQMQTLGALRLEPAAADD